MNEFELAIKSHLDKVASEDSAFAEKYRTKCEVEKESIEKCCNYIISEVQKLKRQAMTDAEVFGMAMHYFDEDKFEDKAPQCKVVVSHSNLSDEDKERIRRQAQEEIDKDAVEQAKKKILEEKKQEEEKAKKKAEEAEKKRKEMLEKQKEEYAGGGLLFGFDD